MGTIAWIMAWLFGAPAAAPAVEQVRVADNRVIIRFDGVVDGAKSFLVADPDRIAIDIAGATAGESARAAGLVAAVRQADRPGEGARILLDLTRPAIVGGGRFTDDGRGLILDLRPVDAAAFASAARAAAASFSSPAGARANADRYSVSLPVPPKQPSVLPEITGGDETRPLVVIDAGHGGHDPGAISPHDGTYEKDVTLAIARATRDALVATGRVRVALTRDSDRFLVLAERYRLARRMGADLFVSIHADSAENRNAHGATAYTLSEIASDKEAARLAARENRADILAGVNLGAETNAVSSILIDLTQRETMNASASFARLLGREAEPLIPTRDVFHRMASLIVLKAPDMPSILFETGYLSNEDDVRRLTSRDGRRAVAESLSNAIEIHFARRLAAR
ncbi:N-acetylmuramoyl-L-alanine amidase [Sphingomonas gilva]|uniref:N-acetylmuramoyl-L-alanine amidase n=1 Tax=Sphingomonas gilva TaxID=2305907 RepID=A0A396RQ13_9SPHN|nr:N-acetylmuramoyl-L-alanine amidase [Sphingomonas gilva]RHW18528.1 N-acetylmuramoyl-L-alanine amidase [Sphingomonas gilva]